MFGAGSSVTPYIGAGIGYVTEVDFDIEDATGAPEYSETGLFSYQFMAGAEVPLSDQLAVFATLGLFTRDLSDANRYGAIIIAPVIACAAAFLFEIAYIIGQPGLALS